MEIESAIAAGDDGIDVILRLLSVLDGGVPVSNGSRMAWSIGNTGDRGLALNDASIALVDGIERLEPGEEALARLRPLNPRFWRHVQAGLSIAMHLGPRRVGDAVVLNRQSGG